MKARLSTLFLSLSLTMMACDKAGDDVNPTTDPSVAEQVCWMTEYTQYENGELREQVTYSYGDEHRLLSKRWGEDDNYISYGYDTKGNLVSINYHDGASVEETASMEYDANGNVTKYTYDSNTYFTYEYDASNRLTKTTVFTNGRKNMETFFGYTSDRIESSYSLDYYTVNGQVHTVRVDMTYEYEDGLLVKKTSTTQNGRKLVAEYAYGEGKGAASALVKANPVVFDYPYSTPYHSYEKPVIMSRITDNSGLGLYEQENYTARYEYNDKGYPLKAYVTFEDGDEQEVSYTYDCE